MPQNKPQHTIPLTIPEAAKSSHLETLVAMRDHLATVMEECTSARDLPPIASRLQSVLTEIAKLETVEQAYLDAMPRHPVDETFDPSMI